MNSFPYFSDVDTTLIKQSPIRDYLGVLPIWTSVARPLEPNLANAISNYRGISAVLFIYYLDKNSKSEYVNKSNKFRLFFQYMEGLIEYFFAVNEEMKPCYGASQLTKEAEQVISIDSGVITNGLYQFYRGSCRRSKLLSKDWKLDNGVESCIKSICDKHKSAIINLISFIESEIKGKSNKLTPNDILKKDEAVFKLFKAVFNNGDLKEYLKEKLFLDENLHPYAKACLTVRNHNQKDNNMKTTSLDFLRQVQQETNKSDPDWKYKSELKDIIVCEPFLQLIDDCFQLIRISDDMNIEALAKEIDSEHRLSLMKEVSNQFLNLASKFESSRFDQLFALARLLREGKITIFLRELISYHQQIMKGRGGDPLIIIEGQIIRSPFDVFNRDKVELLKNISNKSASNNNYYIYTTANIYGQLTESENAK